MTSGAKSDRAQLRRVLARLDAGDMLMVRQCARSRAATMSVTVRFRALRRDSDSDSDSDNTYSPIDDPGER
jgi:hypothetical protein